MKDLKNASVLKFYLKNVFQTVPIESETFTIGRIAENSLQIDVHSKGFISRKKPLQNFDRLSTKKRLFGGFKFFK